MRKFITVVLLMLVVSLASSQTIKLTSDYYTTYEYNEVMKQMVNKIKHDYPCFFEFNEQKTIMLHTTSSGKLSYILGDYTEKDGVVSYKVTNSDGQHYLMLVPSHSASLVFGWTQLNELGNYSNMYIEYNIIEWSPK